MEKKEEKVYEVNGAIKSLNIYEKLNLITKELGVVNKNLNVEVTKNNSYKAVSERDVLDAVKPLEAKFRVYSYPLSRTIINNETLTKKSTYNGELKETNSQFLRLEVVYRFINIDKPEEFVDITSYGDGIDTGDKATGKAMTYADKYALMKCYKISTGDDPDKEASPQEGYSKQEIKATENQVKMLENILTDDEKKSVIEKWGELKDLTIVQASQLIKKKQGDKNE